jgi:class 3 adenylate cyclase
VDNYVGDAIMAVFDRGPDAAVAAGIAMLRGLMAWSRTREGVGEVPIRVGVGIATGELIFGTIGAANRLKCGVVGDTVNLASRIEGLTKHYGLGLLIGQRTYLGLSDPTRLSIREVDRVAVAGRETPVQLYEVFDADAEPLREQKLRTRDLLAEGLASLRAGQAASALRAFESCIALAPDDPLPVRLAERARREAAHRPSPDGVARMTEK